MTSKYIAWILGIVLVLVLGTLAFFWQSRERTVSPSTPSNKTDSSDQAIPVSGETGKDKSQATAPANLDDIAKNVGADADDDLAAMDDEATSELGSLEEGNTAVNDLGKTYDESAY